MVQFQSRIEQLRLILQNLKEGSGSRLCKKKKKRICEEKSKDREAIESEREGLGN